MKKIFVVAFVFIIASTQVLADKNNELQNNCLINAIDNALPLQSVKEIKAQCVEVKTRNAVDKRLQLEQGISQNPFSITPHRPNFLLPFTYTNIKEAPYDESSERNKLDNVEVVFQVSLKYLAIEDIFFDALDLQLAFTSTSWWQAYNTDISSPFRETNYEPEMILIYQKPLNILGLSLENSYLSLNHESNGKSGELSRSWNRVIAGTSWVNDDFAVGVKTWWRIPEHGLNSSGEAVDDNPDIEKYLGYGELSLLWQINDNQNVNIVLRNNLRADNKGAIKIGWSYPLSKRLKGYIEYFNGYGESNIYYNQHVQRFGIGIKLTDWL